MIDFPAAREVYNNFDISNIGLVPDGTKSKFGKPLYLILRDEIHAALKTQWITCK